MEARLVESDEPLAARQPDAHSRGAGGPSDWAGARERLGIERLTKGERVDLSTFSWNRYLELDAIPSA